MVNVGLRGQLTYLAEPLKERKPGLIDDGVVVIKSGHLLQKGAVVPL